MIRVADRVLFATFDRPARRIADRRTAEWARALVDATRDRHPAPPLLQRSRLPVPFADGILFVPSEEMDWIEAEDQYVTLHTGKTSLLMRQPLHALLARLPPGRFAQIHRSHAVNVSRAQSHAPPRGKRRAHQGGRAPGKGARAGDPAGRPAAAPQPPLPRRPA